MRADFLLVDIGNSFAKFQLADATGLRGRRRRLPTAALDPSSLIRLLGRWQYRRVFLCSVVPLASGVVRDTLPEALTELRPGRRRRFGGVSLECYPGAGRLGPDRLAALAGALARHGPPPLLVVNLGTAVTFDLLDAAGNFRGGAIAPGRDALANALSQGRTALLPPLPPFRTRSAPPAALGQNTRQALRGAAYHGFRGLVREIVVRLCAEAAATPKVVLTGGGAGADVLAAVRGLAGPERPHEEPGAGGFPGREPVSVLVDRELTLEGLRIIAREESAGRTGRRGGPRAESSSAPIP